MILFLTLIRRFAREAVGMINRFGNVIVIYKGPRAAMVTIEKTRAGG